MQPAFPNSYPVDLDVDYQEAGRNRVSVLLRLLFALPIVIVLGALSGLPGPVTVGNSGARGGTTVWIGSTAGIVFGATLLMLVFRHKYPAWWFEWNLNLIRFANRVFAYVFLLRDEYPSTDEEQHVHVTLPDPEGGARLNRWLPLVKWFLALPHFIVLVLLGIAAAFATLFAWIAILVTGRHPRALHDFVVGVLRWGLRVEAYAFALVVDEYPPFRLRT